MIIDLKGFEYESCLNSNEVNLEDVRTPISRIWISKSGAPNPVFSPVSSCVGSPRKFIEDCQDYTIDYQSYLLQDNFKIRPCTPKKRISIQIETPFNNSEAKKKHIRAISSPEFSNTKKFNNSWSNAPNFKDQKFQNAASIAKSANQIFRPSSKIENKSMNATVPNVKLPNIGFQTKNNENNYTPLRKRQSIVKNRCFLHRQMFMSEIIPPASKSNVSIKKAMDYLILAEKKPFKV
ncbi:unnamed protein product [Blepharisma stoltei]|uniref:Uncharacterized protein n=1 Tax=Blepharisma stoltei TaxID=1481888 RepID=A0AAU9JTD3_9CILI|nr:unnamed protein product [Blepharisma stoltei]